MASQPPQRDDEKVSENSAAAAAVPTGVRAAKYLDLYDLECPTSEAEVRALVSEHDLKHGDVVAFSDYRDTDSHIAFTREDGTTVFIPNPDDRAAGYLTIPKEVLANVSDGVTLYRDFIRDDWAAFNLHLSPHDKFVVDRLGEVPDDWEFDVAWDWGELVELSIKTPGGVWECFNPNSVNHEVIQARYLSGSPIVSVRVQVEVRGEEYHRYMAKYGDTYSQSPSIPSSWLLEQDGNSSGGADYQVWGWRFHGPLDMKDEVVKSIKDFMEGFTYNIS